MQRRSDYTPVLIEPQDEKNVVLAGLMHDFGHGVYSHLFDRDFMPKILQQYGMQWEHEDASVMLLDYLIDQNNIDCISKEDVRLVGDLIQGKASGHVDPEKKWMFDIIANKTNSLDVDKIDYLQRDAKHLGLLTVGFNQHRLLQGTRIIDNRLCYNSKIYNEVEQVFMTRYKLFKECYSHRVCRAIDYMIVDALTLANPVFHFEETINDPARYVGVTDNYLTYIETSRDPALADAKKIMKRIR